MPHLNALKKAVDCFVSGGDFFGCFSRLLSDGDALEKEGSSADGAGILIKEKRRIARLADFDVKNAPARKRAFMAGCDEAGRGPMAGPLVAACAVFARPAPRIPAINDSKMLDEDEREEIFDYVIASCSDYAITIIDHSTVDRFSIHRLSLGAMGDSVRKLKKAPDFVLVDGKYRIPKLNIPQKSIIAGDSKSFAIAAASIIAKVTRDRMMREFDLRYPQYGFARHKGYCTREHLRALREFGPCPIHRRKFGPLREIIESEQLCLALK